MRYIEGNYQNNKPTNWTMPLEPWHPGKGAKSDHLIQLNCGEVHTHASYKTTRTLENFNKWRSKMILLSDKLWLIANNSKTFAIGSKSEIYLIYNFQKYCCGSNGIEILIWQGKIWSNGKNSGILPTGGKKPCLKYTF